MSEELKPLTNKEYLFLSYLMKQGSDAISRRICEDMDPEAYDLFTLEEKQQLERAYHDWNGDPEVYDPAYFIPSGGAWLNFYADRLRKLAEAQGAPEQHATDAEAMRAAREVVDAVVEVMKYYPVIALGLTLVRDEFWMKALAANSAFGKLITALGNIGALDEINAACLAATDAGK